MSYISEIKDLHVTIKAILLNCGLMPFWYVAIYLFNNDFFQKSELILILSLCVVIILSASFFFTAIFFVAHLQDKAINNNTETFSFFDYSLTSIILLGTWLATLIFIFYSVDFFTNYKIIFYYFVVLYFAPLALYALLLIANYFLNVKKTSIKNKL
jgi:hypothetical protein